MHAPSPPRSFAVSAAQDDARGRRIILAVALLAGLLYATVTPPDRVPDEYGHFLRAVAMAEGNFFPEVGFVSPGHHFPAGIWSFRNFLGKGDPAAKFTLDDMRAAHAFTLNREQRAGIEFQAWYSPVPYAVPAAVAFVGLQTGWRPFWIFYLGRVANLLASLAIAYFALRAIPKRAAVAAALLLLPMTLFELASWSADAMTISVALLLTSLFIRNMEGEGEVTTGEIAAMAAAAFVLGLCKPAYFLLAVPVLFIRRRRVAAGIAVIAAITLGTLLAAASARAGQHNPRPNLPVDPGQQLRCVLDDPVHFAGVFLSDLRTHGRFYLEETIGRLGLMDVKLPVALIVAEWLLLLWVALTCGVRWRLPARLSALAACAITIGGISLAQYLVWSIICGNTIEGIQGRYFLPLLPLLLFAFSWKPRKWALVPIAVAGVVANGIAIAVLVDYYWA
jgi:uncharacterized membrane protein